MLVWIIVRNTAFGGEIRGVTEYAAQAIDIMADDELAVQMEVGKDYKDEHRFVVFTKADPTPRVAEGIKRG